MATLPALIVYALVTTLTPGPNNITATAAGAKLGWKRSLPYLSGIAIGFLLVSLIAGFLNLTISSYFTAAAPWIKWIGCAYLLWLAISLLIGHAKPKTARALAFSLPTGILLQLVNPKGILYGITIYGMFPGILLQSTASIILASFSFALLAFASISLWCLAGTSLSRLLENNIASAIFNIFLAILLALTALSVALG